MNPWLSNKPYDRANYTPEMTEFWNQVWEKKEMRYVHGYPTTGYLQLAILYGVGLYTAKEQGIVTKGSYLKPYWKAHYFDWLLFAKRGLIYAGAGGLVLGCYLFGMPNYAPRRAYGKYR